MSGNESSQSTNINSLFVLLRVSLGKETEVSLPNDVNWQTVYDIAMKQGVGAIACDGLLKLENIGIDEELRYKWMGQSMVVEQRSSMQWNIACEMAELFSREDIKTIALKGISFASYYPMPLHRSSSDIDISLLDDFERGNQIIESKGFPVDREDSKHSHYVINGIPVENHQFCIGVRGNRRNKRVERRFRQLLRGGGETIGDSKVIRPQWLFNALFFMYHAMNHLLIGGGITLKYICDWIVMRDGDMDESKVLLVILAWFVIDSLVVSPLIYYLAMPKPIKSHIHDVDKMTEEETEAVESARNKNERLERILKKYSNSGRNVGTVIAEKARREKELDE